jgi:4'-phosphopantetheinyl transferase
MANPQTAIGADEVRVYLADPAALASDPAARTTLAPEDLAHVDRFHFQRDQQIALASRTLQRRALSACSSTVAPDRWRFVADNNGRPQIVAPEKAPPLSFSVANTRGLVGCAVCHSREIGFDLEAWRMDAPSPALIERCFAPDERKALAALPESAQSRRFVELWTLKEAYIKARGLGLSLPLEKISIDLDVAPPSLVLDHSLGDPAGDWQLALWSPTASHAAALCIRRGSDPPLAIDSRWLES